MKLFISYRNYFILVKNNLHDAQRMNDLNLDKS